MNKEHIRQLVKSARQHSENARKLHEQRQQEILEILARCL
jgi:hypothetical protein